MSIKILTDVVVFSSLLNGTSDTFIADRETLSAQVQEGPSRMFRHTETIRKVVLPLYFGSLDVGNELPSDRYTV